jgi:hypothetical protein
MQKDSNSIIYAVLNQLNPQRWEGDSLTHTNDLYFLLSDSRLQTYAEYIRDYEYVNRSAYNVDNGLYIGKTGLGPIATKLGKVIICFET